MKNLIEIVQIVKDIQLKASDFITVGKTKKAKTDIFYEKILKGEFKSDQEAAHFFFNSDTNNSNYKNLKRSFKEKLTSTLFFLNLPKSHSDYAKAQIYCSKNIFIAKILDMLGARNSGSDLAKKVLKKALEFELTEFVVLSSKILRNSLGTMKGDEGKFDFYNQIFKEHFKIWEAESIAQEYYSKLVLPYAKSKENKEKTFQKGLEYYNELHPLLEQYESPFLHTTGKLIKVIAYLSINDYQSVVEVCQETLLFFEQRKHRYKMALRLFSHYLLISYTQLKNYPEGKKAALKALVNVRIGSYSWFINKELHLTLAFHSKEYEEAYTILYEAISHHKFNSLRASIKERWLIHKSYIHFLIYIEKISNKGDAKNFRLGKFLNSVPTYSKDKRGLNIPILIVQILFMIVKKDYDQSIDRFDAIKKYCSRYLRSDDNLRSNCFINMLLKIPISDFHKAGVERRAQKYFNKLLDNPIDISNQAVEIEVIPYEDLWEIVMESLDRKFHKRKTLSRKTV